MDNARGSARKHSADVSWMMERAVTRAGKACYNYLVTWQGGSVHLGCVANFARFHTAVPFEQNICCFYKFHIFNPTMFCRCGICEANNLRRQLRDCLLSCAMLNTSPQLTSAQLSINCTVALFCAQRCIYNIYFIFVFGVLKVLIFEVKHYMFEHKACHTPG